MRALRGETFSDVCSCHIISESNSEKDDAVFERKHGEQNELFDTFIRNPSASKGRWTSGYLVNCTLTELDDTRNSNNHPRPAHLTFIRPPF